MAADEDSEHRNAGEDSMRRKRARKEEKKAKKKARRRERKQDKQRQKKRRRPSTDTSSRSSGSDAGSHASGADPVCMLFAEIRAGMVLSVEKRLDRRPALAALRDAGTGRLALHEAAAAGHYQLSLLVLRRNGAANHAMDGKGNTPLLLAARHKHWPVCVFERLCVASLDG